MNNIQVRQEISGDEAAIDAVNRTAFGRDDEGNLVRALRARGAVICSLVAQVDDRVAGHALFTPATLDDGGLETTIAALGPVAVRPEYQRQGLGTVLIEAGLEICREQGYGLAVVLGHSSYYPRFGFRPSRPLGIRWEHDAPEEAFMVMELRPGALAGARGIVRYQPEFEGV